MRGAPRSLVGLHVPPVTSDRRSSAREIRSKHFDCQMTMANKKRGRTTFEAVRLLNSQDEHAESTRRTSTERDKKRSEAAQSQTKIYASLVESRILLQRAMQTEDVATTEHCDNLLVKLLEARSMMLRGEINKETDYASLFEDDNEERLNDTLQGEYENCRESWKEVFDRRHKDVRLHAGLTAKAQFRVLDSSFWQQVESTVQHEDLQRRQNDAEKEFDDTKVYQQMLKDFVASNQSSAVQGAQERLKKQSSSSKKKDVDRKASKGRKIRYTKVPKLANFTYPLSRPNNSAGLDEDEFFKSLFGGVAQQAIN